MTTMVAPPHADPVTEGARIAQAAEDAELELRVVGGVAVALRCASSASPPLSRTYKDVDVAGRAADRVRITALLTDAGYLADEQFNALNGARRLLFYDIPNQRRLDVFLDRVELCREVGHWRQEARDSVGRRSATTRSSCSSSVASTCPLPA